MKKSELRSLIREEIQKELNESAEMETINATALLLPYMAALLGVSLGKLLVLALDDDRDRSIIQRVKDWWKSKQDNKAMNTIANRIKDDPEVQEFLKKPNKRGWQKMLATKLTPEEQKYIRSIYRTRFDK